MGWSLTLLPTVVRTQSRGRSGRRRAGGPQGLHTKAESNAIGRVKSPLLTAFYQDKTGHPAANNNREPVKRLQGSGQGTVSDPRFFDREIYGLSPPCYGSSSCKELPPGNSATPSRLQAPRERSHLHLTNSVAASRSGRGVRLAQARRLIKHSSRGRAGAPPGGRAVCRHGLSPARDRHATRQSGQRAPWHLRP